MWNVNWRTDRSRSFKPGLTVLVAFFFLVAAAPAADLKISHQARSLQPGEVLLVKVDSEVPLSAVEAEVLDKSFLFYSFGDPHGWQGLVGIDLEAAPGPQTMKISATAASGQVVEADYQVDLLEKKFPVRHLTVEEKYVSPPAKEMNRIRRESKLVGNLFLKKTRERLWAGPFIAPVAASASSSFGKRSVFNGEPRNPHTGTDFSAGAGASVYAPNSGTVVLARNLYFAGNTVMIDHGMGLYSYLAHLSEFAVRKGDVLKKGDLVGKVGATGRVTGPHLHWTLRLAQARVDPLSLISVSKAIGE